ncbi:nuclear transport factor 2 family protein [Candidatus Latescibacterota bacterium]
MNRQSTLFILLTCFIVGLSCTQKIDYISEEKKIKSILENWMVDVENMNLEGVEKIFENNELFMVWSDSNEIKRWEDYKQHLLDLFPNYTQISIPVTKQKIKLSRSGDVAWFFLISDFIGKKTDGTNTSLRDMRLSGVLERINGKWLIVHSHYSSLPNEIEN